MSRTDKLTKKPPRSNLAGVIVVDKPLGISSMRAVSVVRRRAGGAKTGHAGTLDPLATGVLVMALGRATRIIEKLMATNKRYDTVIDLSANTTTDDLEGDRQEIDCEAPPESAIRTALEQFTGEILQRPPAFSAMKVGGRRAYALARRGETPDLPARPVVVHQIVLRRYDWPHLELDIRCGKGMYVRSLARDLGACLGTGGHCRSIRRTAVGPFTIDLATPLDDIPEPLGAEHLIEIDRALEMVGGEGTEGLRD